jgi:hypothetical protein
MRLFHPAVGGELVVARALNFAIFALALYTFSKFWRAVADWSESRASTESPLPLANPCAWTTLGYLLFATSFLWSVEVVNPDILVAAIVFAVATLLFKLVFTLNGAWAHGLAAHVSIGVLLAIGYYAKSIMLYFAFFVLAAIVVRGYRSASVWEPITALLVFLILTLPFIATLSREMGRFTAGDSGKLNYAWFVDGPETKTWMKEVDKSIRLQGAPVPFYPGDVISASPRVFGLPAMDGVTYAPWYDAARFDKRSHPAVNIRGQLRQIAINLRYPKEELLGAGAALTVPLLFLLCMNLNESLGHVRATWFCTLPVLGVFGMYLLVHLVQRFVLGFSLVLWGAAWASILVPTGFGIVPRRAMLTGIIVFATYTMPGLLHFVASERPASVGRDIAIAQALPNYNIKAGDKVASIGDGQEAYWAHFAQASVVAEVWSIDSPQFWLAEPRVQEEALQSMANSGAKTAVWRRDSEQECPPNWLSLPGNSGCLILLH